MKQFLRSTMIGFAATLSVALVNVAQGAHGDLYEADVTGKQILKFAPDGTKSVVATGIGDPIGLAFDAAGNLYVSDGPFGTSSILKFTPGGSKSTFAAGFKNPAGLAFNSTGDLFMADDGTNVVYRITPAGTASLFAAGFGDCIDVKVDARGILYVTDYKAGTILNFDPQGVKTTFASGLVHPRAMTFDSAGNLFVTDPGASSIVKITPAGAKSTFTSVASGAWGLAVDRLNNLFEGDYSAGTISLITPSGAKSTFATGLANPGFIAFQPAPHTLLNISTRALVQSGDNVLIAGFIVGGNGEVSGSVLVRAIGPTLSQFGVPNPLPDPVLELHDSSGAIIASDDNWKDSQQAQIAATSLAPTDDRESAILARVPAGAYSAIVRGKGDAAGIAVVEVYNLQ